MGPVMIELMPELVEAPLLRSRIGRWWFGRLILERAVHAFVSAILLRPATLLHKGHMSIDVSPINPD